MLLVLVLVVVAIVVVLGSSYIDVVRPAASPSASASGCAVGGVNVLYIDVVRPTACMRVLVTLGL